MQIPFEWFLKFHLLTCLFFIKPSFVYVSLLTYHAYGNIINSVLFQRSLQSFSSTLQNINISLIQKKYTAEKKPQNKDMKTRFKITIITDKKKPFIIYTSEHMHRHTYTLFKLYLKKKKSKTRRRVTEWKIGKRHQPKTKVKKNC